MLPRFVSAKGGFIEMLALSVWNVCTAGEDRETFSEEL